MERFILLLFGILFLNLNAQNCWPPTASMDIDINNVRAKLLNGGDIWWDGVTNPGYEYPKVDTTTGAFSKHLIFAGALWMTALNENGELKCAAQTYRNQGHDFWPGPINFGQNTIQDTTCANFDRFFPILRTEVDLHIANINVASSSLSLSSIPTNVLQWPGKGNAYLSSQYGIDVVDEMAPFQDCNTNGIYDPENGDYPLMKGDQSIFWVINDIGNTHTRSGGDPLEVEIQCMAYAYITNDEVNDATFYDYKIIKKTIGDLSEFYFSHFVDPDLGDFFDDFIGCDTNLNYAFAYNGDIGVDVDWGPILTVQFLNTPNNIGLTSFSHFNNAASGGGPDPDVAAEFRNFQTGLWKDGTPITEGGTGYGGSIPTNWVYPGNPATGFWSECGTDLNGNSSTPGDRRYQMTSGPHNLNATESLEFTVAVIIAETDVNTYNGCPDKNTIINPVVNYVNNFIENVDDNPYACKILSSITNFNDSENLIKIYPNPTDKFIMIESDKSIDLSVLEVYNSIGELVAFELNNNQLELKNKDSGIYTIRLFDEKLNRFILKKFVLK